MKFCNFLLIVLLSIPKAFAGDLSKCTFKYFKSLEPTSQLRLSDLEQVGPNALSRFDLLKFNYPVYIEKDFTGKEYYKTIKYEKVLRTEDSNDTCGDKVTAKIILKEECVVSSLDSHASCYGTCRYENWDDPNCDY